MMSLHSAPDSLRGNEGPTHKLWQLGETLNQPSCRYVQLSTLSLGRKPQPRRQETTQPSSSLADATRSGDYPDHEVTEDCYSSNGPSLDILEDSKLATPSHTTQSHEPYVDKLLGPNRHGFFHNPRDALSISPPAFTFDPFLDDADGPTHRLPARYLLSVSDLFSGACDAQPKYNTLHSSSTPPVSTASIMKTKAQGPGLQYTLSQMFVQHGVEVCASFLPRDLLDEAGTHQSCGTTCLEDDRKPHPMDSPGDHPDSTSECSSPIDSNCSSVSMSPTDYSFSPLISTIPREGLHPSRGLLRPKRFVVKFHSADANGVSFNTLLSRTEGSLIDPDDEILREWGEGRKPAWIPLTVERDGFRRQVFHLQTKCGCRGVTRAELAFEIARTIQRYLMEATYDGTKVPNAQSIAASISDLYLSTLRTDNRGMTWRATFFERPQAKARQNLKKKPLQRA